MQINGEQYQSIWLNDTQDAVSIIDQTLLPHEFVIKQLRSPEEAAVAIKDMIVRGAPLIGATAAWGIYLAARQNVKDTYLKRIANELIATRPTAVNLKWAVDRVMKNVLIQSDKNRLSEAKTQALAICQEDVDANSQIGDYGADLIEEMWHEKGKPSQFNVLTHCNAGWLATVDWGTALAPMYKAAARDIPVHVWVDETRPRNQGFLTAWELTQQGISNTLIVDNAGGHLMQHGLVDLCFVGSDRTSRNGDVCNKIGTYLKALAAHVNKVPFYVTLPLSTFDLGIESGVRDIPIEERSPSEMYRLRGKNSSGNLSGIDIIDSSFPMKNFAFDVTPAKYITRLITEKGVVEPNESAINNLFKGV